MSIGVVCSSFVEVFVALSKGKRVAHEQYDEGNYLVVEGDQVSMVAYGRKSPYVFDWQDMTSKGWVILE